MNANALKKYPITTFLVVYILAVIWAFSTVSCSKQAEAGNASLNVDSVLTHNGYYKIALTHNKANHITLHAKINGIEGLFILDTGASATVIDEKQKDKFNIKIDKDSAQGEGVGADVPRQQALDSKSNNVEISGLKLTGVDLCVMNLDDVTAAYKQLGEIVTDGVIGANILKSGNAIIDYKNSFLYLKK
ncbi:MAG: retropepsin-like aspartic protease [Bacteroidia bacterium]